MMGGRGRFPGLGLFGMGFFFLGGLLRLIIPLGLLVLVAVIFYQLGRRASLSGATTARREPAPADMPKTGSDLPKSD
jgi:hypothetical protein